MELKEHRNHVNQHYFCPYIWRALNAMGKKKSWKYRNFEYARRLISHVKQVSAPYGLSYLNWMMIKTCKLKRAPGAPMPLKILMGTHRYHLSRLLWTIWERTFPVKSKIQVNAISLESAQYLISSQLYKLRIGIDRIFLRTLR